jgi:hypothetical protein
MDIEVDGGGSFEVGRWQASVVELPASRLIAGRLNTRAKQSKAEQSRAEQLASTFRLPAASRQREREMRAMLYLCVKCLWSAVNQTKQWAFSNCFPPSGPDR